MNAISEIAMQMDHEALRALTYMGYMVPDATDTLFRLDTRSGDVYVVEKHIKNLRRRLINIRDTADKLIKKTLDTGAEIMRTARAERGEETPSWTRDAWHDALFERAPENLFREGVSNDESDEEEQENPWDRLMPLMCKRSLNESDDMEDDEVEKNSAADRLYKLATALKTSGSCVSDEIADAIDLAQGADANAGMLTTEHRTNAIRMHLAEARSLIDTMIKQANKVFSRIDNDQ